MQGGGLAAADAAALPGNRLYENLGSGRFRDASAGSGAGDAGYGAGVAAGDFDDDGLTDLYVTNVGRDRLLRNLGGLRFEDVTDSSGIHNAGWSTSAAFLDYDRDGRLDLFVCEYLGWTPARELSCYNSLGARDYCHPTNYQLPMADHLYRNLGGGRFAEVTGASGIGAVRATSLGVGCADFDGDGFVDVFVANDAMPNVLWHNDGDGTFTDVALERGCALDVNGIPKAGMGVSIADLDGDRDIDILVCNLFQETDSFFRNDGAFFSDRTARIGLGVTSRAFTRFGMGLADFDHDGLLDLYQANGRVNQHSAWLAAGPDAEPYAEPNVLFRGTASGKFEEVLPRGGTAQPLVATSRAAAFGDVDGDGAIDVLVVNKDAPAHLLLNRAPRRGNWILLRVLESSDRDALGAELTLTIGSVILRRDVRSAYSYLAANDPRIHVGLGTALQVDRIDVVYADGTTGSFGPLEANRVHVLKRSR